MSHSEEKVKGLICLGYPLCAMGDRTKVRDGVLRALGTPILFVQGTRDALCPLDLLESVRASDESSRHSARRPRRRSFVSRGKRQLQADGETQEEVDRRILETIAHFVDFCCQESERNEPPSAQPGEGFARPPWTSRSSSLRRTRRGESRMLMRADAYGARTSGTPG